MQEHLNRVTDWLQQWKLIVNPEKCAFQIYTKKKIIPNINLRISHQNIKLTTQQRVLGILFDAPKLSFKNHIINLHKDCSRRIQVMRAISSNKWGASRILLRRVYISFIRSKIEYGSILYDELPKTSFRKIECIQNQALRIMLGVRKTSPVSSMEVEAYVTPLDIRLRYLFMKWFSKMLYSPRDHNNWEIGKEVGVLPYSRNNSSVFATRGREILSTLNMGHIKPVQTPYFSSIPPEVDMTKFICYDMFEDEEKIDNPTIKKTVFHSTLETRYPTMIEIYTDGSKLADGSTSAAFYVPSLNIATSFKLNPSHTVLGSELFGILKALQLINSRRQLRSSEVVIISDSKTALYIIANTVDPTYKHVTYKIQNLLLELLPRVRLQWVRRHIVILGNEGADKTANLGHSNNMSTLSSLSYDELIAQIKKQFFLRWATTWKDRVIATQKRKFLSNHQNEPKFRPWLSLRSRLCETVSARLRIGHIGVNAHLQRFEMKDSNDCENCDVVAVLRITQMNTNEPK